MTVARQGKYIFDGYISGRGMFYVFSDMDNPDFVFAESMKRDVVLYVSRSRVEPRKRGIDNISKPKPVVENSENTDEPLTLF